MESEKNLSAHAVNLLQKIAIEATKEDESLFFVPLIPSLPINCNLFDDKSALIDELKMDEVSQPNPQYWASQKDKSVSQIYQTFLDKPDFDQYDFSQIPKHKDEEVDTNIQRFDKRIQMYKNKDNEKAQDYKNKMDEAISKEKVKILGNNIADFEYNKLNEKGKEKLNVNFDQANEFKDFCRNNDNGQNPYKFYQNLKYNSNNEKTHHLNQDEQKQATKLKGFGLGIKTNSENLTLSLENSFSDLIFEAEWCKINFKREWIHNHIFSSNFFGIQGEEKFSWSNGSKFNQDETAKLPYLTVGAVVARNIVIQGIKSNQEVKETLQTMEQNKQDSYALFFKLINNSDISRESVKIIQGENIKIQLSAPRIIGFVLKPFDAFPKYSKETEWFSATLNVKEKARNQSIISQDTQIFVKFLGNSSKYFKNFENLYKECLNEWKQNNQIDIQIDQGNEKIDEDSQIILQVKVDTENQTYTLGSGEQLQDHKNSQNFNQKFSHPCINELISHENIEYNLRQRCKRLILHEIGRLIGFYREHVYDEDVEFNKVEVVNFFKKNLRQLNEVFQENKSEDQIQKEAQNLAEQQIFIKNTVSNFEKADKKSIMFIPYPKNWIAKPENYAPTYNYRLSESDHQLLNQKFLPQKNNLIKEQQIIEESADRNKKMQEEDYLHMQFSKTIDTKQKEIDDQIRNEKIEKFKREKEAKAEAQRAELQEKLIQEQLEAQQKEQKRLELEEKQRQEDEERKRQEDERIRQEEEIKKQKEEEKRRQIIEEEEKQRQKKLEEERQIREKQEADRILKEQLEEAEKLLKQQMLEAERIQNEKLEAERLYIEKEQAERMLKEKLEGVKKFIAKFIKENQLLDGNYPWNEILECFDQEKEVRQFENWQTIVEEVYNEMKLIGPEDDSLQQQLPKIEQFDQKQALKLKLERDQVQDKIPALILKNSYLNLQLDVILQYKKFYSDHKIITNNISHILPEEEDICVEQFKKWLKEGQSINDKNLKDLKQITLIHHLVVKELYEQKIKVFEDESIIISTFQKYMVEKLSEKQIAELLFIEDENLKNLLLTIFKFDQHDYFIIKNAMQSKNICLQFLDNKIESFINNVNSGNIEKGIEYLEQNYLQDPVLCMKILYYLSTQKQQQDEEEKKEEAQEEEMKRFNIQKRTTVEILKKKKYQILKLYKNKNIARVIQKGFLISKEENQYEAFKNQKIFEERQLFGNESDNNKIKKFLQDFSIKEEQNMRTSQKMNNTNQIFQELFKDSNMDVKLGDHEFIQTYMTEQEGYEKIMEYLGKKDKDENEKDLFTFYSNEENKDDANNASQQSENDIEKIAKYLKTPIVIHNIDNIDNEYKVYGENYFNSANGINAVHIVIDNKNEAFHLLQSFDLKIKIDVVNSNVFQTFYPSIFQELLPWMKTFFGYKNLFKFIYDERQQISLIQNVSILDDFSKEYVKYKADNSDENFRQMQQHCQILENLHQSLFNEWYEQIKKDNSGKNFVEKYDFQRARQNTTNLVQKLKQIKDCFPDPSKLFDLRDFNRLSCRVDTDTLRQCLKEQKHQKNPLSLANEVITQMFGFINRRETISTFISVLRSIDLPVQVSSRFLISMLLQQSDISLRSRIIHYQSEYYSVPLIMNCQSSYLGCNQQIRYVPEIAFNMLEGFGVFNFGAGNRTIMPVGKSQVANDLLFPSSLFNHEAFEQQDKNLFSAGQVDVFFEKSFDKKRNIVMMDGQGSLKDQAITSALILTNIVIIHFQNKDFQDQESLNDLMKKIKMIKNMKNNIKIILIIRDANESKVIKPDFENKNQQTLISMHYPNAKYFEKDIDFCVELYNMGSHSKIDRIKEVKTISKIFYELIDQMNKDKQAFHFTKQNFLDKFIKKDTTDQSYANDVIKINEKAEQFMKKVETIKDNIFDEKSLPILRYKNLLRNKIVEIRQNKGLDNVQDQQDLEEKLDNQKNEIELKLRQLEPSQVLEEFLDIVNHPNNSMILQEISKKLRILTQINTEEPKKRKEKLIEDQKANTKDLQIQSKDEIDKRNSEFKIKIEQIDIEIYQKSISLEYFWRCLVFYLGKEPQFQKYNCPNVKDDVVRNIESQLKNGDCFELIDGENLEFKGLFIQEVIKQNKKDKVIVVCVIGPQSTGKSTLMNFAFGTQFFTSAGRCTKGIYFTLQKIPDTCQDNQISWLLMLDTEGLQSPERIDDEYDRKIVLFAMLSADVLIINSKGEINANMINTLKMCCVTYDALQKYGYTPEIIYTNGQNDRLEKGPFKDQVQELKSKVIEASDSPTIEKVAEQLLGYNDDKIQVFGYAYKSEVIEKDNEKGLKNDYNFKISNTNFGVETARIYNIIQKVMNDPNKGFREINMWLEESKENWSVIDRFSASINQFSNLEEFRNDKKVSKYLNEKWIEYISKNSILQKDDDKCVQEKQRLIQIFQQFNQETLEQEIHKVEQENIRQKDIDLEKEVFQYFDEWKQLPLQRGITVLSEKNHKSNIRAKMDVIQNEFRIKLRSKIKEEQMLIINQNGHRKVLNRAYKLSNDENFKKINQNDKIKELQKEFNDAWKQSLDEIRGEAQIEQMKKSYFDDLQRTFKIFNPFIEHKGEIQFKQLLAKVEETHTNNQQDNSLMQNLLLNILTVKMCFFKWLKTQEKDYLILKKILKFILI